MNKKSTFALLILIIILPACGDLKMEEVKKELLPEIKRNSEDIQKIQRSQVDKMIAMEEDVLDIQKNISKIRDRLNAMQLTLDNEIAEQNEYLAKMASKQFDTLEKEAEYLAQRIAELKKIMAVVKAKSIIANKRVKDENESPPKPVAPSGK
jgi:TolA-binding protein